MIRLSHFAAPAVLGTAMFIGIQGCAHDRADEIPASASEISTGTETVTATAPHDGMLYIWDQNANKMLYTGRAEKGDTVRVDAKHNKIYMNDKLVTKRDDLINDHHYKVFFDQSELDRSRAHSAASYQAPANGTYSTYGTQTTTPPQQQPAQVQVQVQPQVAQPAQPAQPQSYQQTYPQQQQQAQPAAGTTVYTPGATNPNTTVVVPDNAKNTGTTVVVPPPPTPSR
jgi:hypothetical protein